MYDMPISQAAIDLGLKSQMLTKEMEDEQKRKRRRQNPPSMSDQLMGGAAFDIFG